MGLLDRLFGRSGGRYVPGTVPEDPGEGVPPPALDPYEAPPQVLHTDHVSDSDVVAAYGVPVARSDIVSQDDTLTHVVFTLAAAADPKVDVFIRDHRRAATAMSDESSWRAAGVAAELDGPGDTAFLTDRGAVFARLGRSWTVQILAGGPESTWRPPAEESAALARSILERVEATSS